MENIIPSQEGKERLSQAPTLRDTLIDTTFNPHRAIDPQIKKIDLAAFQEDVDMLRGLIVPGSQIEHGKLYYVTTKKTLLKPNKEISGTESEIMFHSRVRGGYREIQGEKVFIQDRFVGTTTHTHPSGYPFSPQDLYDLFLDDEIHFAETAASVVTTNQTMVLFRGNNTPEWEDNFTREKVKRWDAMVRARIQENLRPRMSQEEIVAINARAQSAFLRQAIQTYDLQLFTCGVNESILVKASA
ncbi:MAG TPA: hypothetical protein VLF89_05645 [Candidatus Saccharimonadales bacterium]|nr:hypothetical protein [Candidatus Saccharimonadales bacterium]